MQVAESIAGAMTMRDINVFPLQSSKRFWAKMGYTPKRGVTRVLYKDDFGERHLLHGKATIKKLSSHQSDQSS